MSTKADSTVTLTALQDFSFAHGGVDVRAYSRGDVIETDDHEFVEISTREKWAKRGKGKGEAES